MQATASRRWRPVNGVLLFDKPLELSSNIALQKVRRLFQAEKAGHTGTLDPLATGLLPICFGEATKFTLSLLDADKIYRAWVRLGQTTTTGDAEGEVTSTQPVSVSEAQVRAVMLQFTGEIEQIPPMYSALKHEGKPLYEYVRKGEAVHREARKVTIHEIELEQFAGDALVMRVRCSKGTYIRTLAEDIGHALGCGAHLSGLRRLAIAQFDLAQAHTLAELEAMDEAARDACLLPLDSLLQTLPRLELDATQLARIARGQRLGMDWPVGDGKVRLYANGLFVGVGEVEGRRLSPSRLLASVARDAARGGSAQDGQSPAGQEA
ncbi:MAG TPA: tRNA pseudouridine(55) synthase TruB [Gallionellaceae bacterium]|nr:tRNA pseudouridine(55) synthase TruB [Gallionellaceae bacterium]